MPSWFSSPVYRTRFILVSVLLVIILYVIVAAWTALVPFLLGVFVAYLLLPAVNLFDDHAPRFLRHKGWSRPLAILLVYLIVLGVIAGIFSSFVPIVATQAEMFVRVAPGYIDRIEDLLTYDISDILDNIPPQIQSAVQANLERAAGSVASAIQRGLGGTIRTLWATLSFILGLVVIPFWLFLVLRDQVKVSRAFYSLVPEGAREDVRCIVTIVDGLLSAYVRGQLLLCLLVGGMVTVILLIFGVDLAVLLGTFAGIFELIPILGPYLGAIPAVLIALLERPILGLWVAISFAAIQQIENMFLVPRIAGHAVRFHPAVVMILVIVGSEVGGIWGMLLSVPVAAMVRDVFQYLYMRTTERGATPEMAMENLRARTL